MVDEKLTMDELDDLIDEITNDTSSSNFEKLKKLTMTTKDNKGTAMFVIIPEGKSSKFYRKIQGIRELNIETDLIDAENNVWHKILPKEEYGELTEGQSLLYDQVSTMFDSLYESDVWGDDSRKFYTARYRTYTFMYGYLLKHLNSQGAPVGDTTDRAVFLSYPCSKFINQLSTAIESKTLASGGNKGWLARYFSRAAQGRTGALVVKVDGGKGGYNIVISFEGNNEDNPYLIPADLDLTNAFEQCQDLRADYLGWQNGEESYFNEDLFLEMRAYLSSFFVPGTDQVKTQEQLQQEEIEKAKQLASKVTSEVDSVDPPF